MVKRPSLGHSEGKDFGQLLALNQWLRAMATLMAGASAACCTALEVRAGRWGEGGCVGRAAAVSVYLSVVGWLRKGCVVRVTAVRAGPADKTLPSSAPGRVGGYCSVSAVSSVFGLWAGRRSARGWYVPVQIARCR